MITHDLGVVAEIADDVVVMYAAQGRRGGPVDDIFNDPRHPYTWGLMGSLPRLDVNIDELVRSRVSRRRCSAADGLPVQSPLRAHDGGLHDDDLPLLARPRREDHARRLPSRRGDEGARGGEARLEHTARAEGL